MSKNIKRRVEDGMREDDREHITKYLDWLFSSMRDYSQTARRMSVTLILLAAAFELVVNSKNSNITISSFRIARGSVVLDLIPAIIAYFFLQIAVDMTEADELTRIYRETFRLWSEKAEENDLHVLLAGSSPIYWAVTVSEHKKIHASKSDKTILVANGTFTVGFTIAIYIFEAQAYYILLPVHSSQIALWLSSLIITIVCLVLASLTVLSE